ncbi:S41 family peptidase [Pedobacter sp. ASV28]|uniref:S41 family peptidase n=1 Tax=Pedobacter sp. ASV28 TaxID=2795123 RepID=UPI0018ED7646|nr:S41 family peptidase [Pedobacter sp. ASV28]
MKTLTLITTFFMTAFCYGQSKYSGQKFSPAQLRADVSFLKQQLFVVHANPFTEQNKKKYEKFFTHINEQLTDSMDATSFFKLVRPAVAPLSDEHAQIRIGPDLQTAEFKTGDIFLPFTLSKTHNLYFIDDLLAVVTGLNKGDKILEINGQPIHALVRHCTDYATGFPEQRANNALSQFGYLYAISQATNSNSFKVKLENGNIVQIKGITYNKWIDYLTLKADMAGRSEKSIGYNRYGDAGYLTITTFNARSQRQLDSLRNVIEGIFRQIKLDGVKSLFIDVSRNGGGNSAVGDMIIDFFYDKPYRGYQCNWKRSDEYLSLLQSWGIHDDFYLKQPVGQIIHLGSQEKKVTINHPVRFNGPTYVVIGNGTFSSAIMFATTVKDNHMATLIGQVPKEGHPNHFGEMYNTKLPNTRLDLQFGVKEWIRPAGKKGENTLRPDRIVELSKGPEEVIRQAIP